MLSFFLHDLMKSLSVSTPSSTYLSLKEKENTNGIEESLRNGSCMLFSPSSVGLKRSTPFFFPFPAVAVYRNFHFFLNPQTDGDETFLCQEHTHTHTHTIFYLFLFFTILPLTTFLSFARDTLIRLVYSCVQV